MSGQKSYALSILEDEVIDAALVLPFKTVPEVVVNLELISGNSHLVIRGQGEDVAEGNEVFYLVGDEEGLGGWWTEPSESDWKPHDLVTDWRGTPLGEIWKGTRKARLFYDSEDRRLGLTPRGIFQGAAAIEISPRDRNASLSVVFYASADYPFSIEIATTADRQREILAFLTEFQP